MYVGASQILEWIRFWEKIAYPLICFDSTNFLNNCCRICGIHHLERPVVRPWNFFECVWFVVVTFSTVGYGDFRPDDWPGQTFVIIMIACALILLPVEVGLSVLIVDCYN